MMPEATCLGSDGSEFKQPSFGPKFEDLGLKTPGPCAGCANNPANGGSGICNCILGQWPVK